MELTLTKLPWYAQVGAFVALAVAGCGLFYYYYEMPVKADMMSRQTQLVSLRADVAKGLNTAKKLPEFKSQVTELEGRLANLKAILPEEKDAADLLNRMQTVAAQSNMTIKGFKPSPTVTKQLHAEWPITLELEGSYHNLALLFDRVGRFTRIVNISALDVKGKEKPEGAATITATCVATTFVLLEKPAPATPGARPAAPPAAENFSYRAEGRRDPFQSLLHAGSDAHLTSRKGDGPSAMTLGEVSVRGIMQSRGSLVAMIQGPDTKTYIVHQGDKLLDGTIKTITPQGLIVIQEVNDPLSLVKQREVRKLLRSLEDAK